MSTRKETVEFILEKLGEPKHPASTRKGSPTRGGFAVRAMFGEYALYADSKVVGLICNDQLYVKIMPESAELEDICDTDEAYPGSKKFYVVEEVQLSKIKNLPEILLNISKALPANLPRGVKAGKKKVKKSK